MPAVTTPSMDIESAIASFRAGVSATAGDALLLPNWGDQDWRQLFRYISIRTVMPGDALIRHGEPDRTIYFVLRGQLEVIVPSGDGISMGSVALGRGRVRIGRAGVFRRRSPFSRCLGSGRLRGCGDDFGSVQRIREDQSRARGGTRLRARSDSRDPAAQNECKTCGVNCRG